jgi:hypothetical protein
MSGTEQTAEERAARWRDRCEQKRHQLDAQHNVITTFAPLLGWEILLLERWKPGVVRFHARKLDGFRPEFQMGFARDEIFAALQLPAQEAKR